MAKPKPSHQTAPLGLTALPTDTVSVTDPTHPWYGLTFPLVGLTSKPRLGRVCVVWLHPGIERVIPLAATCLAEAPVTPSPCRLSLSGLHSLLAVVASLADNRQEDAYVEVDPHPTADAPATALTLAGTGTTTPPAIARWTLPATPANMAESVSSDPGAGPHDPAASDPGGAA